MKKKFCLLLFVVGILVSIFQGCENDYSEQESRENEAKADMFISSQEYRHFSLESRKFSREIMNCYLKLSNEQRKEFEEINDEISQGRASTEELNLLCGKLSSMIGINYQQKIKELSALVLKLPESSDISNKDILIALKKRSIRCNDSGLKIKTRAESGDAYQECLDKCERTLQEGYVICGRAYKENLDNGTADALDVHMQCCAYASSNANKCRADCIKYLPRP